ncbi:MAG: polynucleotide adenylyltransferase PcnB [Candidatus Symbiodolus clandestinus]
MRTRIFTYLTGFFRRFWSVAASRQSARSLTDLTTVIPCTQHPIAEKQLSSNALKVLYRLHRAGYQAYLVGGSVRDLLLGQYPKDFDIATNATPEQVKQLFNNCRLVGKRFRLAHILFGRELIEVSTFRAAHPAVKSHHAQQDKQGRLLRDNVYGTIEEDAQRRDFTINSLYYNITDRTVLDYTGGLADLRQGVIRLIGDAENRYREDPVRILRAIRFSAKLNMPLSSNTAEPIQRLGALLLEIPEARLFDESLKLLQSGCGYATYQLLENYQLSPLLFPAIAQALKGPYADLLNQMVPYALQSCDHRLATGKSINPAFLFAALLWYPLLTRVEQQTDPKTTKEYYATVMHTTSQLLAEQCQILAIPRRFTLTIREIWQLQLRLRRCQMARAQKLLLHPKFRAAYDLLALRAKCEGEELLSLAAWWQEFQQKQPIPVPSDEPQTIKRRRRYRQHSKG